jgi:hypothetical protein
MQITDPSGSEVSLKEASSSVTSLSYTLTLGTITYKTIEFYCKSDEANTVKKLITIDNNAPTIEWTDSNNQFIGTRKITITAKDNKVLESVKLDINGNSFVLVKETGSTDRYSADINSLQIENKEYTLKASASDKAGNITEISRIISIENMGSSKQKALKTIETAKEKQKIANDQINYYKTSGLELNEALKTKKLQADVLLASAITEIDGNNDLALYKAIASLTLFEQFITESKVETTQTETYSTDTNNLVEDLKNTGLTEEAAKKQQELIQNSNIERKLSVIKTGDGNFRQVKIEVSFINDTNDDIVKIIEIIPKEFLESAKNLISDVNFRIIEDDPIVEFTVNAPKGAKASFSYSTGEISAAEADKIIQTDVIQKFTVPPLIAESKTNTEELLGGNNNIMSIIIAVIVLIIIVVILGIVVIAALFTKFISHPHGFGEQKSIADHIAPKKEEPKKKGWKAN